MPFILALITDDIIKNYHEVAPDSCKLQHYTPLLYTICPKFGIIISDMNKKQHVLIVGAGFGGTKAALELADDEHFQVTLLSESADLRYYPTLYHTATGGKRANSSIPLTKIFAGKAVKLVQGTAATIDRKAKVVTAADGQAYAYDTLILALGVVTN